MKTSKRHSSEGQAMIEFAFTLAAFMVVFFCISDVAYLSYQWLGIQFATNRGARIIKMLPDQMNFEEKRTKIRDEMERVAQTVGIPLDDEAINITLTNTTISIETIKEYTVNPLSGLLMSIGGDNSRVVNLRIRETLQNESL